MAVMTNVVVKVKVDFTVVSAAMDRMAHAAEAFMLECQVEDSFDDAVIDQFVADGGDPWDVWQIEEALLGETLEEAVTTGSRLSPTY